MPAWYGPRARQLLWSWQPELVVSQPSSSSAPAPATNPVGQLAAISWTAEEQFATYGRGFAIRQKTAGAPPGGEPPLTGIKRKWRAGLQENEADMVARDPYSITIPKAMPRRRRKRRSVEPDSVVAAVQRDGPVSPVVNAPTAEPGPPIVVEDEVGLSAEPELNSLICCGSWPRRDD
eukprot:1217569-Amphidinium_carterae.1